MKNKNKITSKFPLFRNRNQKRSKYKIFNATNVRESHAIFSNTIDSHTVESTYRHSDPTTQSSTKKKKKTKSTKNPYNFGAKFKKPQNHKIRKRKRAPPRGPTFFRSVVDIVDGFMRSSAQTGTGEYSLRLRLWPPLLLLLLLLRLLVVGWVDPPEKP